MSHATAPRNGTAPASYLAMESLPVVVPWPIVGSPEPMRVVYRLDRVMDLLGRVYQEVMAPYLAEEERIDAARGEIRTADRPPADAASQLAALDTAFETNNAAGMVHLLAHTVSRVLMPPGAPPLADPTDPAAWAAIHPALRTWLATQALAEVRSQLDAPFLHR